MSHRRSDGPTRPVPLRLTDAELGRVDAAAQAEGLNRSDYIRLRVLAPVATDPWPYTDRSYPDGDGPDPAPRRPTGVANRPPHEPPGKPWTAAELETGAPWSMLPENPMVSDDWRAALTDPNQPDPLLAANGGDGAWGKEEE